MTETAETIAKKLEDGTATKLTIEIDVNTKGGKNYHFTDKYTKELFDWLKEAFGAETVDKGLNSAITAVSLNKIPADEREGANVTWKYAAKVG